MGWGRWGREARLPPAEAEAEAQGSPPEEEDAYHRVEAALLHIEDSCHREGGGFRGGGGRRGIGSVARVRHRCLLRLESEQWYPPNIQRNESMHNIMHGTSVYGICISALHNMHKYYAYVHVCILLSVWHNMHTS
jgi:hypothetical protein